VYLILIYFVLYSDGILCQDVMMLNFFPQLSESEFSNNHEFIFVIDRSGLYWCTLFLSFLVCFIREFCLDVWSVSHYIITV